MGGRYRSTAIYLSIVVVVCCCSLFFVVDVDFVFVGAVAVCRRWQRLAIGNWQCRRASSSSSMRWYGIVDR